MKESIAGYNNNSIKFFNIHFSDDFQRVILALCFDKLMFNLSLCQNWQQIFFRDFQSFALPTCRVNLRRIWSSLFNEYQYLIFYFFSLVPKIRNLRLIAFDPWKDVPKSPILAYRICIAYHRLRMVSLNRKFNTVLVKIFNRDHSSASSRFLVCVCPVCSIWM